MDICPFFKKDAGCRLVINNLATYGCGKESLEIAKYYYKDCEWYKKHHKEA